MKVDTNLCLVLKHLPKNTFFKKNLFSDPTLVITPNRKFKGSIACTDNLFLGFSQSLTNRCFHTQPRVSPSVHQLPPVLESLGKFWNSKIVLESPRHTGSTIF